MRTDHAHAPPTEPDRLQRGPAPTEPVPQTDDRAQADRAQTEFVLHRDRQPGHSNDQTICMPIVKAMSTAERTKDGKAVIEAGGQDSSSPTEICSDSTHHGNAARAEQTIITVLADPAAQAEAPEVQAAEAEAEEAEVAVVAAADGRKCKNATLLIEVGLCVKRKMVFLRG